MRPPNRIQRLVDGLGQAVQIQRHFHFLCPMRPMNPDETWGFKQHRVYRLDEDGNRIRDQNGKFLFDLRVSGAARRADLY